MRTTRPAIQAETVADWNGLPHGRITEQGTEAHVFTAGLDDLVAWFMALGGHFTCEPAPTGSGVCLWTLHTDTDHGHGATVRVHALALDTDQIDADCADAITHTPAA